MARRPVATAEPLGIVISQGTREEPVPRFSLYVWGPPVEESKSANKAA